jgi:hypothetical protein
MGVSTDFADYTDRVQVTSVEWRVAGNKQSSKAVASGEKQPNSGGMNQASDFENRKSQTENRKSREEPMGQSQITNR